MGVVVLFRFFFRNGILGKLIFFFRSLFVCNRGIIIIIFIFNNYCDDKEGRVYYCFSIVFYIGVVFNSY